MADLSTMIGGQPVFVIRKFLRQVGNSLWGVSYVMRLFDTPESEARAFVAGLARKGYIKRSEVAIGDGWWEVSAAGKRFATANASKKIRKEAAELIVRSLIRRAHEVNENPGYLYSVRKITAFGSYVEGDLTLDDIDAEIELEPKEADEEKHQLALEGKVVEQKFRGMKFATEADELGWGELEVLLFLRARSRYLSFIHIPPEWRRSLPNKVLFEREKQLSSSQPNN
jgi:hypothetical protein